MRWSLTYEPRKWQLKALARWQSEGRGIVEVVTGGGKTVFAFMCMLAAREKDPSLRFLIVVPSVSLLDQWVIALREELNVSPSDITQLGGGETPNDDALVTVAVINSARTFSQQFADANNSMLIVDECHRAGSIENSKALQGDFRLALGLSATPEREYDDGFIERIQPALGPVIYNYTYVEAAEDGVIADFSLVNIRVPMLDRERSDYDAVSKRIAKLVRMGADEDQIRRALIQRAAVVNSLEYRVPATLKLLEAHKGERAIVFHERVPVANRIAALLGREGHNAVLYHSKIDPAVRRENLRLFRKGVYDVLVCCRALDEGMNAPETSVAVVASSTASSRQRVQRLGRILRPAPGKREATVYTLFASKEEEERLVKEAKELKNISQINWRQLTSRPHEPGEVQ